MALDSDIASADAQLHVEFFIAKDVEGWDGKPFIRIMAPGDKTNIIEQPVREDHKERFPRQWLYFQMQNTDCQVIGTPLIDWRVGLILAVCEPKKPIHHLTNPRHLLVDGLSQPAF